MQPRPPRPLATVLAPVVAAAAHAQRWVARRMGGDRSLAVLLAAGLALVLAATAATAALYDAVTEREGVARLDGPVSRAIASLRTEALARTGRPRTGWSYHPAQ